MENRVLHPKCTRQQHTRMQMNTARRWQTVWLWNADDRLLVWLRTVDETGCVALKWWQAGWVALKWWQTGCVALKWRQTACAAIKWWQTGCEATNCCRQIGCVAMKWRQAGWVAIKWRLTGCVAVKIMITGCLCALWNDDRLVVWIKTDDRQAEWL